MLNRFPRSLTLLNAVILLTFSLALAFGVVNGSLPVPNLPGVYILCAALLLIPALLNLFSEWFDRKNTTINVVFIVTQFSFLLIAVFEFFLGSSILFLFFLALIILNLVSLLSLAKSNSKINVAALAAILFSLVNLASLLFFRSFVWTLPSSLAIFVPGSSALALLLGVFAWIFQYKKNSHRILISLSVALLILSTAWIAIFAFDFLPILLFVLSELLVAFCQRIDSTKIPLTKFAHRWVALIGFWILLLDAIVAAIAFLMTALAQLQMIDRSLVQILSILIVFIIEIIILCSGLFVEINQRRMEKQLSTVINAAGDPVKTNGVPIDFYSSPALNNLIQISRSLKDKTHSLTNLRELIKTQTESGSEKQLRFGMANLSGLSEKLENTLDLPVSSQYLVSALQKTFQCDVCGVFTFNADERRLVPLAISSIEEFNLPFGFRLRVSEPLISKSLKLQDSIIATQGDHAGTKSFLLSDAFHSFIINPLFYEGYLEGLILLADRRSTFFNSDQMELTRTAGSQLLAAWNRHNFIRSVASMIESSSALANINELPSILQKIVEIGRRIIRNQFTAVVFSIQDKVNFTYNGKSPELRNSIESNLSQLANQVFRISENVVIRDIRRDQRIDFLKLDDPDLKTLLICPIRIHGLNIGALLFFGKRKGISFSEQDSFLAGLLAMQSAALIEGCILDQELRNNLITTQLLHGLNLKITQANDLDSAVNAVVETAYRLSQAEAAGLVLFSPEGRIESQAFYSSHRTQPSHPRNLIQMAMKRKELVTQSEPDKHLMICFPILTAHREYGGLWLELTEDQYKNEKLVGEINNLVHQASIALERSILLKETRDKADQVSLAYYQLQTTYDQTLMALVSAIDLRDRETEGHSIRVAQLALAIGKGFNLSPDDLKALERGSLLHDVGKIGISDTILHKPGPLSIEEWKIMRSHPSVGAQIIESIPFLKDAVTIVANHQERWDGSGYPKGLKGEEIPLLARIFSVADVFDALISDRPYHARISPLDAVEYLKFQANILFDPVAIKIFTEIYDKPNFLKSMGFYEI